MINNAIQTIVLASDHGGFELKSTLKDSLSQTNYNILDLGTDSLDSVDYPDYAYKLARKLINGQAQRGVLVCGSGIGISIAANRYSELRAALIHDEVSAKLSRQHNDANVIVFGGRFIDKETALRCLNIFLDTEFDGGRHERRVNKLSDPKQ